MHFLCQKLLKNRNCLNFLMFLQGVNVFNPINVFVQYISGYVFSINCLACYAQYIFHFQLLVYSSFQVFVYYIYFKYETKNIKGFILQYNNIK